MLYIGTDGSVVDPLSSFTNFDLCTLHCRTCFLLRFSLKCLGARSEALASALLDLHGLQDMLDKLWGWVSEAEATIKETELVPIENNLEAVEQQLTDHEVCMYVCMYSAAPQ